MLNREIALYCVKWKIICNTNGSYIYIQRLYSHTKSHTYVCKYLQYYIHVHIYNTMDYDILYYVAQLCSL